jgi:ribosome-interacting GTPase 1
MGELEDLMARVEELERRIEILFTKTGAIDMEELGRDTEEPSEEVKQLVAEGKIRQAVKLYQQQTGADMAAAMGAIGKLGDS